MFPNALKLVRIGGVQVRIDRSWFALAALFLFVFYQRFATAFPVATAAVMGVVAMALFFASVLAHELAHALEAKHRGIEVEGVTLFLFGGVTEMHLVARRPRDEFAVAAVGPYVSLVSAALFGLIATRLDIAGLAAGAQIAGMLGWLNLILAIFNFIPGAPLDGGRVLRSIVWAISGNRVGSIRFAARAGQLVGIALVALGVRALLVSPPQILAALEFGLIGWFVLRAAAGELRQAGVVAVLDQRTVASLDLPPVTPVDADQPLEMIADRLESNPTPGALAVSRDAMVIGVLRPADVFAVDAHDRRFRTAADLMQPLDGLPTTTPEQPLAALVHDLGSSELIVVRDGAGVSSVLTPALVEAAIARLQAADAADPERRGGRRRRGRRTAPDHLPDQPPEHLTDQVADAGPGTPDASDRETTS